MKPCRMCGKMLDTWMQFGRDYLHPLCWSCSQSENDGQYALPERQQPELWDQEKDSGEDERGEERDY